MNRIKHIIGLVFILLLTIPVSAQVEYMSEEELQENAEDLFEEGKYSRAYPLYSQLLSLHRKNPEYNYKFGACQLFTDKSNKKSPIKYLEYAYENLPKDKFPRLHYFMGLAYHQNYQFKDAIGAFKIFKILGKNRDIKDFNVERKIQICYNGIDLLSRYRELYVLKKIEVRRKNFYLSYNNEELPGNIIKKPSNLYSRADKKRNVKDVIFFSKMHDFVLFSSYGRRGKTGKDIYIASRDANGEWKEPERLGPEINTSQNEDYPYLMPDGKTLYFSSKGHNTMGGYDIFKSVYDSTNNKWSEPENINFPFNTPYDDIMFITDTSNTAAYFSSTRSSVNDLIYVYKVGLQRQDTVQNLAAAFKSDSVDKDQMITYIRERAELNVNTTQNTFEKTVEEQKQNDKEQALARQKAQEEKRSIDINRLTAKNVDKLFDETEKINSNIRKLKKNQLNIIKIRDIRTAQIHNIKEKLNSIDLQQTDTKKLRYAKEKLNSEKQIAENLIENYERKIQALETIEKDLSQKAGKLQITISDSTIDETAPLYIEAQELVKMAQEIPETKIKHLKNLKQQEKKTRNSAKQLHNKYNTLTQTIAQTEKELNLLKKKHTQSADQNEKQAYQNQINQLKDSLQRTQQKTRQTQEEWIAKRAEADSLIEKQHTFNQIIAVAQDTSIQIEKQLNKDITELTSHTDLSLSDSLYARSEVDKKWKKDSLLYEQEQQVKSSDANQYLQNLSAQLKAKQTTRDNLKKASAIWAISAQKNIRKHDSLLTISRLNQSKQTNEQVKAFKKKAKKDIQRSIVAQKTAEWIDTLIQQDQSVIRSFSKAIKKLDTAIAHQNEKQIDSTFRSIKQKVNKVQPAKKYFDQQKTQFVQKNLKKSTSLTNKAFDIDSSTQQILLDSAQFLKKEANDIWQGINYDNLITEAETIDEQELSIARGKNELEWLHTNKSELLRFTTAPDSSDSYFDQQYAQKIKNRQAEQFTSRHQKQRPDTIPSALISRSHSQIAYRSEIDTQHDLKPKDIKLVSASSIKSGRINKSFNTPEKDTIVSIAPKPASSIEITKEEELQDNLRQQSGKETILFVDSGQIEVKKELQTKTKEQPTSADTTTSDSIQIETKLSQLATQIDSVNQLYDKAIDTLKQQQESVYAAIRQNNQQIDRLSVNLDKPQLDKDTLLHQKNLFIEQTSDNYVLLTLYESISQRLSRYKNEKQRNLTLMEKISVEKLTLEKIPGLYANIKTPKPHDTTIPSLSQKAISKSKEKLNKEMTNLEDRKTDLRQKASHYKQLARKQKEKANRKWFTSSKEKWNQKAIQTLSKADSLEAEVHSLDAKINFVKARKSSINTSNPESVSTQLETVDQTQIADIPTKSNDSIRQQIQKTQSQELSRMLVQVDQKLEASKTYAEDADSIKDTLKEIQPVDMVFIRGRLEKEQAQKAQKRAAIMKKMADKATSSIKKEEYQEKAENYERKADSLKTRSENLFAEVNLRRLQDDNEIILNDTTIQTFDIKTSFQYEIQSINQKIDSLEDCKSQAKENAQSTEKLAKQITKLKDKRDDIRVQFTQTKLLNHLDQIEKNKLQLDIRTDSIKIKSVEHNIAVREKNKAKENFKKMQNYIQSAEQTDDQQEKIEYLEEAAKFARITNRQQEKSKQQLQTINKQIIAQEQTSESKDSADQQDVTADSTAIAQTEVSKKEEPTETPKAKTDSSNRAIAQKDKKADRTPDADTNNTTLTERKKPADHQDVTADSTAIAQTEVSKKEEPT
ncbi:MAG: hypothetical protein ACOCPM_02120, partial [Bacteroidales bacterium]